jgi:hypothetical protein
MRGGTNRPFFCLGSVNGGKSFCTRSASGPESGSSATPVSCK